MTNPITSAIINRSMQGSPFKNDNKGASCPQIRLPARRMLKCLRIVSITLPPASHFLPALHLMLRSRTAAVSFKLRRLGNARQGEHATHSNIRQWKPPTPRVFLAGRPEKREYSPRLGFIRETGSGRGRTKRIDGPGRNHDARTRARGAVSRCVHSGDWRRIGADLSQPTDHARGAVPAWRRH